MTPQPSLTVIRAAVAKHYGLSLDELRSDSRSYRICHPRQLAMLLSRELTSRSFGEIGLLFGGRDHSTVHSAVAQARARVRRDRIVGADARAIRRRIARACAAGAVTA